LRLWSRRSVCSGVCWVRPLKGWTGEGVGEGGATGNGQQARGYLYHATRGWSAENHDTGSGRLNRLIRDAARCPVPVTRPDSAADTWARRGSRLAAGARGVLSQVADLVLARPSIPARRQAFEKCASRYRQTAQRPTRPTGIPTPTTTQWRYASCLTGRPPPCAEMPGLHCAPPVPLRPATPRRMPPRRSSSRPRSRCHRHQPTSSRTMTPLPGAG
jgi:hypothetical protein